MTTREFTVIVGLLAEQLLVLQELRDLMVGAAAADDEEQGCPHPDEHRTSLATPSDPDHWYCRDCKYEHKGMTLN